MPEEKEKKEIEELRQKLKECEKEKAEFLVGWQRSRADFLNYKKEEMERIQEIIKYANTDLILKILPILDNFELVEKQLPPDLKNNQYLQGVFQVKIQLESFLRNQGIEEIKTLGEKFDPNFHEVVEEVSQSGETFSEKGKIIEEIQKGYKLHGKVIRPAKVKIVK